jgi:hypothetical protein
MTPTTSDRPMAGATPAEAWALRHYALGFRPEHGDPWESTVQLWARSMGRWLMYIEAAGRAVDRLDLGGPDHA